MPFQTSKLEILASRAMHKHWLFFLLMGLSIASFVSVHVGLLSGLIFTFFVPGLIFQRFFNLKLHEILVFVPVFSVLVSTQLIYYLSLIFGYSRDVIIVMFFVFSVAYGLLRSWKTSQYSFDDIFKSMRVNKKLWLIFFLILIISSVVLYRSIWFENDFGIVITGSNWQDTPLHYEIIESLNNGNFPPEMPYYSGVGMNYHYFVDFHTAILEKMYGFLPKILPFLNAAFILIFALSVYSLARVNGKRVAIFATLIAIFGWGFSYIGLFSAFASNQFDLTTNYMYQYDRFFGLPPIFDNLLQQRPMLIGLPVFCFVLALLRDMEDKNRIILAGVVTGLLFPFNAISFICAYAAFFVSVLLNINYLKRHYLYFLVSGIIALPFLVSSSSSLSIMLAPLWALNFLNENPVLFYFANLGVPFLLSFIFFKKVTGTFLKIVFFMLFLAPNLISITPNPWDMYKFFIFSWVPIAVLSGGALARFRNRFALVLLLLSVLTTASVITYNLGTNYQAASWNEYNVGMWVRNSTEEKAVFLTYYSIHCPPTMIGGRLRVASYVNWPYGHGLALDDVYSRIDDVNLAYTGSEDDLRQVVEAYDVMYIYVGKEELNKYPGCTVRFNSVEWLELVYNDDLLVYKVAQ
jgi:hypothetical protein